MDSLWNEHPEISYHLMDCAIKQSSHQFHKIFFSYLKMFSMQGRQNITVEANNKKEWINLTYKFIYKYICLYYMWREWLKKKDSINSTL